MHATIPRQALRMHARRQEPCRPLQAGAPRLRRHAPLGFTLLEIMVALAVAGIVLSALFGVYATVMDASERVHGRAEVLHTARLGLARLAKDLEGIPVLQNATQSRSAETATKEAPWQAFQGQSPGPPSMAGTAAILSFPTASGLEFSSSFPGQTLYRVVYTLEASKRRGGGEIFALQRQQVPLPYLADPATGQGPSGLELTVLEGIRELSLRFFTGGPEPPRAEWGLVGQGVQGEQPGLPAAVQVEIVLQDRQGQEHRLGLTAVPGKARLR